jgi:hypothetical protein
MRIVEIRFDTELGVTKRRGIPPQVIPPVPHLLGAGTIVGQGLLSATGTLFNFAACNIDCVVTLYLVPRCLTPQVNMPIAYVTQLNMPGDSIGCTGTTTTIPATGAFQTLVEGNSTPAINQ